MNLVDFCDDPEIQTMASMVMDLLVFDLARFTHDGMLGAAAGRAYFEHKRCIWDQDVRELMEIFFGARGVFLDPNEDAAQAFASSRNYVVPDALLAIGLDKPQDWIDRSRYSINFDEAGTYSIGFDSDDDVVFWWGHSAYFSPDKLNKNSHKLADRSDLLDTNPWKVASEAGWGITLARGVVLGPIGFLFGNNPFSGADRDAATSAFAEGSSLTRANLYTYRNSDAMLSSVQNFHSGQLNSQSQPCQATLGGGASVWTSYPPTAGNLGGGLLNLASGLGSFLSSLKDGFTLHIGKSFQDLFEGAKAGVRGTRAGLPFVQSADGPDEMSDVFGHDGPNYWTGNVSMPRVVQQFGAAIIAYEPNFLQLSLFGDRTHAWFPLVACRAPFSAITRARPLVERLET
jgi:hypothetical protein